MHTVKWHVGREPRDAQSLGDAVEYDKDSVIYALGVVGHGEAIEAKTTCYALRLEGRRVKGMTRHLISLLCAYFQ